MNRNPCRQLEHASSHGTYSAQRPHDLISSSLKPGPPSHFEFRFKAVECWAWGDELGV